MFSIVSLSKSNFHLCRIRVVRVANVLLVSHSCRTRVVCIALLSHSCHSSLALVLQNRLDPQQVSFVKPIFAYSVLAKKELF